LQDKLPPHYYFFLSYIFASHKIDEEIELIQRTLQKDATFSISKLFTFFDTNDDRMIQFDDFNLTMQKLDIVLKREELQRLFQRLGGEDDGVISYAEFAELFRPKKTKKEMFWDTPQGRPLIHHDDVPRLHNYSSNTS
jgi:hypothetical protein